MDLRSTQLKDTYGNLLTIGTTAGSPTTGTLENGDGEDITSLTIAGDINFGDNDKAIFGAGSDLQIYHTTTGNHSIIAESGSGNLILAADNVEINNNANNANKITATTGGAVTLFYNNSAKLATTATGIDVTGTVTADGVQSTDGDIKVTTLGSFVGFNSQRATVPSGGGFQLGRLNFDAYSTGTTFVSGASIQSYSDGAAWTSSSTPAYLSLQTTPSGSTSLKERIKVASNGDISFYDDTGTNPDFYWDASAGSLGIGTTNPSGILDLQDSTTGNVLARVHNTDSSGTGAAVLRIANSGNNANGNRIEFSDNNYYTATISGDRSQGLVFRTSATGTDPVTIPERMRIDSSGNVGIGVTPSAKLHVNDTTYPALRLSTATSHSNIYHDGTTGSIAYSADDSNAIAGSNHQFYVDGAGPFMIIESSGNVLIGTTATPNGTSVYGSAFIDDTNDANVLKMASSASGPKTLIQFFNPNGTVGSIATNASATAYNTSSDYRLKENVVEMTGALDRVDQLKPSRFNFIADADTTVDGFLAHEVADVVPEAITGEKDATEEYEVTPAVLDDEGNVIEEAVMGTRPVYQGIDQSKLVPLLVGAIQELRAEIEQLKNQ